MGEGQKVIFYEPSGLPFIQQGDLFPGLPFFCPPESDELLILNLDSKNPEQAGVKREKLADNAFENGFEHVAVTAERGLGMLITPTCDLGDTDYWVVSPVRAIEEGIDRGNLVAGKYFSQFYLPAHPEGYFEECYCDLRDLRLIHKSSAPLKDRIATLAPEFQDSLSERIARVFGRGWGNAPGEEVLKEGFYRCRSCIAYSGISIGEVELKAGQTFPECPDCKKIHKHASWYLLRPHKKS